MTRTVRTALAVGVPAVALAACAGLAPYYSTIAVWEIRNALPVLGLIALALLGLFVGIAVATVTDRAEGTSLALGSVGFALGLTGGILWMLHTGYDQDRTYNQATVITSESVPQLGPRAPYQVGEAQARPNLGDTGGDIAGTSYLPGEDRYATLVERRGWLSGYEVAFTQQVPLQGRGTSDRKCSFDRGQADARSGGNLSHNLGRLISKEQRGVRFAGSDIYAYCDGDRPVVVVPLKRQTGVWVVVERPAGVALYDGRTGEVTITSDTAKIPGPSYPLSLAKTQRESTAGRGSFADWVFNRAGWETPDDDTNSGNDAEFTLSAGGQPVYVTPLTGRGSATAISVVTAVPARHSGLSLAPMRVHKLDPVWVSPKAITDRIRADYQDIPNWQNVQVYEVIPTGGNAWVATLGTGQNVLYRATGTGDLRGDKPTCLQQADGRPYRCGTAAGVNGNGIGTQYGPGGTPAPGSVPSGNLRGLSDAQLAELLRQVAAESACRTDKTCKPA